MDEIINYKLKDFLRQPEELVEQYNKLLKNLEPIPTANRIVDLKLKEVEFIKQNINNQDELPTIFSYVEGVDEKGLMNMKILTFYGLYNSILKQLEAVLASENTHLVSIHSDYKWEAVEGSKRLSKLGILPMVDNLAGGDILKYEDILELPYMTVFKKLMLDILKSDIQKDMEKIKTKE
jgi:hypothetical protein